jgi:hypothetical protein
MDVAAPVREIGPVTYGGNETLSTLLTRYWLHSTSDRPKLRVGLLLDSKLLMAPLAVCIEHIRQSNFAELALCVYNKQAAVPAVQPGRAPAPLRLLRLLKNRASRKLLGWTVYDKLDARFSAAEREQLAEVDISALVAGVPRLDVEPISQKFVHRFPPEAIEAIRSHSLDILIRFGFNILKGDILRCAKHGVWSYHHGDNDYYRGGPAHFWEIVEKHPHSGIILQVLNEELDGGTVLCKGLAPTSPAPWVSRNRIAPYLLGTTFIIRKAFELHRGGDEELKDKQIPHAPYQGKQKIYRRPGNWQVGKMLASFVPQKIVQRVAPQPPMDHWRIGIRPGTPQGIERGGRFETDDFRWAKAPQGRFWADPFLIEHEAATYCFFEDFDHSSCIGHIAVAEVAPDGAVVNTTPIISCPYHLSYPFVFEDAGDIYMIPESGAANEAVLYRAVKFPYEWRREATLLNAPVKDTTIVKRDGLYWMFTSVSEPRGASAQLVLLYSTSLTGPYQFHYHTPLSADCRYARPAGRIFERNGQLIRPSQDATGSYGSRLHFHSILKLNPREYAEELIMSVESPSGYRGIHTYDSTGRFEVIDGKAKHRGGTVP